MTAELRAALAAADEAYLIGMSNKGIYKRAVKDLEDADVTVTETEDGVSVALGGEVCTVCDPLWESRCTCPSRSVCRHLVGAIVWLRDHAGDDAADDEDAAPDEDDDAPRVTDVDDADADADGDAAPALPEALYTALSAVTEAQLRRALGTQARGYVEALDDIVLTEGTVLGATLPDGTAVRLLAPLEASTCACHKKELCPHKAAAILAWQVRQGMCDKAAFVQQAEALPDEEAAAVRAEAARDLGILADVLQWGLVRCPERLTEHLEAAAVQCHGLRMADAESALRGIRMAVEASRERRAVADTEALLHRICRTARSLVRLQEKETIGESDIGAFRDRYEPHRGSLTLLPMAKRPVFEGAYQGMVYYFLDVTEGETPRFLQYADLRPVFYETSRPRRANLTPLWNSGLPMRALMTYKLVLENAKIAGDKLSSSQETALAVRSALRLDCDEVRSLVWQSFRAVAADLVERDDPRETAQLYLICPQRCLGSGFDRHTQRLTVRLEDGAGTTAAVQVKYRAETKSLVENLERIAAKMTQTPDTTYVWLCRAALTADGLALTPIEVYDSIHIDRAAPAPTDGLLRQRENAYVPQLLALLDEVGDAMTALLQAGSRTAGTSGLEALAARAGQAGMQGLADLLHALTDAVAASRHSVRPDPLAVLRALLPLARYVTIAKRRLYARCAAG